MIDIRAFRAEDGPAVIRLWTECGLTRPLEALGCPKLNVQIRAANAAVVAFYEKLGYARDETIVLGKRLIPDE